jgi:hypothetical protein
MNSITFPLSLHTDSAAVADLQSALLALLERSLLLAGEERLRRELSGALSRELENRTFADATGELVSIFQKEHQLRGSGEVDEPTANALNALLRELGLLDPLSPVADRPGVVAGRVTRGDGQAFAGVVRAFHVDQRGAIRLGEDATDGEGNYAIRYQSLPGESVTRLRLTVLDETGRAAQTTDLGRAAASLEVVDLQVPLVQPASALRRVQGRIVLEHGTPATDLPLRLFRLGFGGSEAASQVAETVTGEHGIYSLSYAADGPVNLELRAVDATGSELALSGVIKNAAENEVLNLVAPARAQPSAAEFTRLVSDLLPHVGDTARLATTRESSEQPDLTLLHEATGWDARVIATAANATRLSAAEETGLPGDVLYGLLRAGLPSDKLQLARVSNEAFDQALSKARATGIVELSDAAVADIKPAFERFKLDTRLAVQAPGSHGTYGDLLKTLDLTDVEQATFGNVYLNHRGDAKSLWQKVTDAGLEASVPKLQKQGKLAFLTTNNPELTAKLQTELAEDDPRELVKRRLYKKEEWLRLIDRVPPAYGNAPNPKEAYGDDMARKIRISYSTEVTWHMISTGELEFEGGNENLTLLLNNAIGKGFKLGQTPIDAFLKLTPEVFQGVELSAQATTVEMLKALQRVYQITPSTGALKALLSAGLLSAHDVLAHSLDEFLERFGDLFGSEAEARLVYRKAEQVGNLTHSLLALAQELDSSPPIKAMAGTELERRDAKLAIGRVFPTLESLFGSLDFCECEHCRSVLSPAAYLVDLLQFLDREPQIWNNTLKDWARKHGNAPYPFKNQAAFDLFVERSQASHPGEPEPDTGLTPYQVLIERRPDLPHIQLTCENTNTALPQIDLVNEILEYYVANNALKQDAARDTGSATTAELLAEPEHVIVEAYTALEAASYPLALPFDLWLETARQFSAYFDVPFWQLLDAFRQDDALFGAFDVNLRAAVFFESLGLSPAEIAIFTNPDPLRNWFALYGFAKEREALTAAEDDTGKRIDLNSAKALSRRLAVTYKELVEIVRTSFVNPGRDALVTLHKLELDASDVFFYVAHERLLAADEATLSRLEREQLNEVQAFEGRLDALTRKFKDAAPGFDARVWLKGEVDAKAFDAALVLSDSDAGANFDLTTLRRANGDAIAPIELLRINLFVRLWRKLGWSIEETDRALQTFVPRRTPFEADSVAQAPLRTALVYMAHLKALEARLRLGKDARTKLLTLWSALPTTGTNPLYAQLFLKRDVLKADPVFDHVLGQYLSDPSVLLADHRLVLQGALGLTASEIDRILEDRGLDASRALLTLENVSILYRTGLLSKALRLPIQDFLALIQLTGLDPFKPLSDAPLVNLEDDSPFTHTLRFIEVVDTISGSGLTVTDLDYLLRHRFDPAGKYRLDASAMLALTKTLAEGIDAIRREHAVPTAPASLSDEALRQKLGLALPAEVVETFLAMLAGTVEFTATLSNVATGLDPATLVEESAIRVSYDSTRRQQRLSWRGVLLDQQKAQVKLQFPFPLVSQLLDDAQAQARAFFDTHLLRQSLSPTATSGFLDQSDFEPLFGPLPLIAENLSEPLKQAARAANEGLLRQRRARLAQVFLPFLQLRLIREFVVKTITSATGADAALLESLVTESALLADPSEATQPLLAAFAHSADFGVSASFFAAADASGPALATLVMDNADTSAKGSAGTPLAPPAANSVRFEGYLEVPTAGAYRFHVLLGKQSAEAELSFAHAPNFELRFTAAGNDVELSEFIELRPGVAYAFRLELRKLNGGAAQLLVQGQNLPKGRLGRLRLYAESVIERSARAQILLAKALQLIAALGLNERELRHILAFPGDFDGVSLSRLPTRESDDTPAGATALFGQWLRLAGYAKLKAEVAGGSDELIGVFEADTIEAAYTRLAVLARREPRLVQAAAEAVVLATALTSEEPVQRLWTALQLIEKFGVAAPCIQNWAKLVNPPITPSDHRDRAAIAAELRETLKSRFEPEAWQRVARSVFDKLRQRQRDALVAQVMHRHDFERLEQLFEFFLIDPGVEPVVQSSRIRTASAAVQIFIHRCLLNLEPKVSPSAINSKQWQWMKRYPVWAGNRRLFLFPENVLEPEFRDDKTHLFSELEGKLLQGDVSSDLVEDAFFNYLQKLEELARLDIVGMYCEEQALDPASNQLHVIGRTYGEPHKYFYRRYAHDMWTPWEPMTVEIQGDHVVPVVWRDRLHVFWVTFMEQADTRGLPDEGDHTSIKIEGNGIATHLFEKGTELDRRAKLSIYFGQDVPEPVPEKPHPQKTLTLAEMSVGQLAGAVRSSVAEKLVNVQLHWSEYFQGAWSMRESGEFNASLLEFVPLEFNSSTALIHASVEYDEDGEERAVKIHLGGAINHAFRVVSRNSRPETAPCGTPPPMPYATNQVVANRYAGSGNLKVKFTQTTTTVDGKKTVPAPVTQEILKQSSAFTLLSCSGTAGLGLEGRADAENLELASLVAPVFYQDGFSNTFFVEPTFKERTIEEWEDWVSPTQEPETQQDDPGWWDHLPLKSLVPKYKVPVAVNPDDPIWRAPIDSRARFGLLENRDWLANPGTVLHFDDALVGPTGRAELAVKAVNESAGNAGAPALNVNAGSAIAPGTAVVTAAPNALAAAGLSVAAGSINVVGSSGLNSALLGNARTLNGL